ncbi:MAG: hypothetical protein JO112_18755 [Planctomycetes bacterium]|nr:hypothetical protein [Planctomycetota bacterium]
MLVLFCLRLACGLLGSLLFLGSLAVNPRFYRTQFLVALGLGAAAAVFLRETAGILVWLALILAMVGTLLGSLVWSLEGAPGGQVLVWLTTLAFLGTLAASSFQPFVDTRTGPQKETVCEAWQLADDLTSAALLGTATTAMLMGHFYLIAPSMSLAPLLRLLSLLFAAICLRLASAAVGLGFWTMRHSLGNLEDVTVFWLPLRWGLGLVAPLVLGWMAREAARIRSTQSATGILYVVVIFGFLGELTSMLLYRHTGYPL